MYFYNRESELYHMMNDSPELYHYGIPGMKWGKRKLKEIKNWYEERKKSTVFATNDSSPSRNGEQTSEK